MTHPRPADECRHEVVRGSEAALRSPPWRPGCSSSGAAATPWCRSRSCARAATTSPGASRATASASADLDRVGVGVLGTDGDLAALVADGYARAFVAVGDNAHRQQLSEAVVAAGGSLVRAVSPAAVVSATARRRRRGARDARRGRQRRRSTSNAASSSTRTPPSTTAAGSAPSPTSRPESPSPATSPSVRARSSASAPASLPGVCIGAWATVGAGASVVRDVAPGETVVGVPARPLRPGHTLERRLRASSWCAPATSAARRWSRPSSVATWPPTGIDAEVSSAGLAAPAALQPDRRLRRVAERARCRRRRAPQQARLPRRPPQRPTSS